MLKVGLMSDTHGYFGKELQEFFKDVDVIWHAGDFGNVQTLEQIAAFKPLVGVYGNCDDTDVRMEVPEFQDFEVEKKRVLMIHIGGYPGRYDHRAFQLINQHKPDIFICGHSHILKVMNDKHFNMLAMNPGACGLQGPHAVRTVLRFEMDSGEIRNLELGQWERD